MKTIIVILMLIILCSLGSGLYYLIADKGHSQRVVKALTIRIALSITLFILILIAYYFGLIKPQT